MSRKRLQTHLINRNWCKGCGICVKFCPRHVLELDAEEKAVAARPDDCICCKVCEYRCPDFAIEVVCQPAECFGKVCVTDAPVPPTSSSAMPIEADGDGGGTNSSGTPCKNVEEVSA